MECICGLVVGNSGLEPETLQLYPTELVPHIPGTRAGECQFLSLDRITKAQREMKCALVGFPLSFLIDKPK